MKDKIIGLMILYFLGISNFLGRQHLYSMNDTIRTKVLLGPFFFSIICFGRDIYDILDSKYDKKNVILSVLNIAFFIAYIAFLNTYIAKGLL